MRANFIVVMFLCVVTGVAFGATPTPGASTTFSVKAQPDVKSYLYFQGTVQPLRENKVLSPIAGVVSKPLNFNYGDVVHKGEYLLALEPNDQESSYRGALLSYLRAKSSYGQALTKYTGQKLLFENKILARNDFEQYKNNLADQKLALQESLFTLRAGLKKVSNDPKADANIIKGLSGLSIDDQQVYKALNRSFSVVKVYAPNTGVALLPPKTNDANTSTGELTQASVVKLDQVMLVVGDFSGLKINISVNEVSINKLKVGQVATVTGPAFPGITLQAKVATISYQAKAGGFSSGLPEFPVTITVQKLKPYQRKLIHAGMSAQVKISLSGGAELMVPITAVSIEAGISYVQLMKNNQAVKTLVNTGVTTPTMVAINSGLKAGDNIVVPH
jgi:multidrug efflux pump subunit AcrA (membrane-fusion protein)